jgi:ABC-type multidrug transport system permease subunit
MLRVLALLTMLTTLAVSIGMCATDDNAGGTPWVIMLVGMMISGFFYNRGGRPKKDG